MVPESEICPYCGCDVHPISGRCKHCKGDLKKARKLGPPTIPPDVSPRVPQSRSHQNFFKRLLNRWPLPVLVFLLLACGLTVAAIAQLATGDKEKKERVATVDEKKGPIIVHNKVSSVDLQQLPPINAPVGKTPPPRKRNLPVAPNPPKSPALIQGGPPQGVPARKSWQGTRAPPAHRPGHVQGSKVVAAFIEKVAHSVCIKLSECEVLEGMGSLMCRSFASRISTLKLGRESCHFEKRAAEDCLRIIREFPCDLKEKDMTQMLFSMMNLKQCAAICGDL